MNNQKKRITDYVTAQLSRSVSHRVISRRLYLYDFSAVFADSPDVGFLILNDIKEHFNIPFSSIKIAGSAQIGHSFHKDKDFTPGESDLDVAIINEQLFKEYFELAHTFTRGYTDNTKFDMRSGNNTFEAFKESLCKGMFRPDLMPNCQKKTDHISFFNRLSNKHLTLFKSISCAIYFSEHFFEFKQQDIIPIIQKGN